MNLLSLHRFRKLFLIILIAVSGFLIVVASSVLLRFLLLFWIAGAFAMFLYEPPFSPEFDAMRMKLFFTYGERTTEEIADDMRLHGYRAATLVEMLVWFRSNPEVSAGHKVVVALASSHQRADKRQVAVMDVGKEEPPRYEVDLDGNEWASTYCFLGIALKK